MDNTKSLAEQLKEERRMFLHGTINLDFPSRLIEAAGVTNLARNIFSAAGSATAGLLMQALSFSAPLLAGGGIKVLYDVLLYRSFRRLKPPEEEESQNKLKDPR